MPKEIHETLKIDKPKIMPKLFIFQCFFSFLYSEKNVQLQNAETFLKVVKHHFNNVQ